MNSKKRISNGMPMATAMKHTRTTPAFMGSAVEEPGCSLDHFLGSGSQWWRLDWLPCAAIEYQSLSTRLRMARRPVAGQGFPFFRRRASFPREGRNGLRQRFDQLAQGLGNRFGRAGAFVGVLGQELLDQPRQSRRNLRHQLDGRPGVRSAPGGEWPCRSCLFQGKVPVTIS